MAKTKAEAILMDGKKLPYIITDNPPRGGMKYTYFAPDKSYVVQFFNNPRDVDDAMKKRLEAILGRYNPTLAEQDGGARGNTQNTANYFSHIFCWPLALVKSPEFGIVCPAYPKNFFFDSSSSKVLTLKGKDKKSKWFTSPKVSKYVDISEKGDFQSMLSIGIQLARAIRRLHQAGLAHSDLSSNNVLIDPKTGTCVVIDVDSLVVPGLFPPEVAGTSGYIAPEVIETANLAKDDPRRCVPSATTDLFALPVLLYEYFLHRHPLEGPKVYSTVSAEEDDFLGHGAKATFIEDPKDQSNRPKDLRVTIDALGPALKKLFLRAFVNGLHTPFERPSAMEWERALMEAWDLLEPCANPKCPAHWFICADTNHNVCPFCGTPVHDVRHVLFYKERRGRTGQWMKCGKLNLYNQQPLFHWHFFPNEYPDEKMTNRDMVAYISVQNGNFYLVNYGFSALFTSKGNRVLKGEAITLQQGMVFQPAGKGGMVFAVV